MDNAPDSGHIQTVLYNHVGFRAVRLRQCILAFSGPAQSLANLFAEEATVLGAFSSLFPRSLFASFCMHALSTKHDVHTPDRRSAQVLLAAEAGWDLMRLHTHFQSYLRDLIA